MAFPESAISLYAHITWNQPVTLEFVWLATEETKSTGALSFLCLRAVLLDPQVWGKAQDSKSLTRSQMLLVLLVHGLHSE